MSPRRLGLMIKRLREERGLSQKALGARAKVTDAYVAMLETGKRKNPSLPVLKRLAKALGVPVTALLE
jgi:transcriptional regulator with XRE-family HTH domain